MAIKLIRDPGKKIELLLSRKKENMQEKKSANQKIKKNQFKAETNFDGCNMESTSLEKQANTTGRVVVSPFASPVTTPPIINMYFKRKKKKNPF